MLFANYAILHICLWYLLLGRSHINNSRNISYSWLAGIEGWQLSGLAHQALGLVGRGFEAFHDRTAKYIGIWLIKGIISFCKKGPLGWKHATVSWNLCPKSIIAQIFYILKGVLVRR
jgi:hypothetical protein